MKISVLFEQKKKSWYKQHFAENKTEMMQRALTITLISMLPKYIKLIIMVFRLWICTRKHK
jgi:hypothetical protein